MSRRMRESPLTQRESVALRASPFLSASSVSSVVPIPGFRLRDFPPADDRAQPGGCNSADAARAGGRAWPVANRLVTARRAYKRLLRVEIATYASSEEEVEAEIRELLTRQSNRWHPILNLNLILNRNLCLHND